MQWTKVFVSRCNNVEIIQFAFFNDIPRYYYYCSDSSWKYFIIKIIKTVYKQLSFVQLQTVFNIHTENKYSLTKSIKLSNKLLIDNR